jgi:hypothetical protein
VINYPIINNDMATITIGSYHAELSQARLCSMKRESLERFFRKIRQMAREVNNESAGRDSKGNQQEI